MPFTIEIAFLTPVYSAIDSSNLSTKDPAEDTQPNLYNHLGTFFISKKIRL